MPVNARQGYYAFISYSHEDASWAERLHQDLIAKGIPKEELFLDQPAMKAGELWREQLRAALNHSRYIVVLWSKNAAKSEWVDAELANFEDKINTPGAEMIKVHQRMIFISLDADNEVYKDIQMIRALKEANAYDPANPSIDQFLQKNPQLWADVVESVYQVVIKNEVTVPVSQLTLATTSDRLNSINFSEVPAFADFSESLDDLLTRIQIGTKAELIGRYGPRRSDWKPVVGNNSTVKALLDSLRDQINSIPDSTRIRWEPVGNNFWDDPDAAIAAAERLAKSLAVIVIDPISLYDPKVYNRFNVLKDNGCFDNENAVVLVLSPFTMPEPNLGFRDLIRRVARQIFNDYYQPGVRKIPYAMCSVNFGDDLGVTRPVVATIRKYFYQTQPQPRAVQTSVGEVN
jgi:hypothetical protein